MSAIERIDVPVRGGQLATYRFGDTGPPVLSVHGATTNSRCWLALSRTLGDNATLIAPDIRGRGRSNGLGPPYGMAAHAADMLAVLDYLGIERAVVVGHSLGAAIVARLAADHHKRTSQVIMIDGGPPVTLGPGDDPQTLADAVLAPAISRLTMRFPTRESYHAWWRVQPAMCGSDVTDADLYAYTNHDLEGQPPALHCCISEAALRADTAELFKTGEAARRLTVPAKLVHARRPLSGPTPLPPAEAVEAWASAAPNRQAILIPDCNHHTIIMGARGAVAVAAVLRETLR